MKIVHTSDIHLDEHNRFNETIELLRWMVDDFRREEPDLILICGDSSPVSVRPSTPLERLQLSTFYIRLAGLAPVIIVRGNHDCADSDIDIYGQLAAKHPIRVFSMPGVISVHGEDGLMAIVAALPWPSKGFLMKQEPESKAEIDERCRTALKDILYGIKGDVQTLLDVPTVFVGHLNVAGSDIGGFTLIGTDVEVSAEDLEMVGCDYYALGHIHKMQNFGPRIWYSGSPRRVDFGEENEPKGYLIAEVEHGKDPLVRFRPTPVPEMQTIHIDVRPLAEDGEVQVAFSADARVKPGAAVRVIVKVDEDRRATFDEAAMMALINAHLARDIRVEYRVTPKQRVRSVAIQSAKTDAERLRAYLGTLEPAPGADVTNRLLHKLELVC